MIDIFQAFEKSKKNNRKYYFDNDFVKVVVWYQENQQFNFKAVVDLAGVEHDCQSYSEESTIEFIKNVYPDFKVSSSCFQLVKLPKGGAIPGNGRKKKFGSEKTDIMRLPARFRTELEKYARVLACSQEQHIYYDINCLVGIVAAVESINSKKYFFSCGIHFIDDLKIEISKEAGFYVPLIFPLKNSEYQEGKRGFVFNEILKNLYQIRDNPENWTILIGRMQAVINQNLIDKELKSDNERIYGPSHLKLMAVGFEIYRCDEDKKVIKKLQSNGSWKYHQKFKTKSATVREFRRLLQEDEKAISG